MSFIINSVSDYSKWHHILPRVTISAVLNLSLAFSNILYALDF